MKIAIVGAGRIGSMFAWQLSRAGHDVTLIARGKRLEELQRHGAIVSVKDERAAVKAAGALDPAVEWDGVMVTVMAHQVDELLPSLRESRAKSVIFMFNTFEPVGRLRDAVGAERFAFGFPVLIALFEDGKLRHSVRAGGQVTTVTSEHWAKVLAEAGIPTTVEPDIDSWLRSHAAFILPLMAAGCITFKRKAGLSWAESRLHAQASAEAFGVVKALGHRVIPLPVKALSTLPGPVLTAAIWAGSRGAQIRDMGSFGPGEVRKVLDALIAAAPGGVSTEALRKLRPEDA